MANRCCLNVSRSALAFYVIMAIFFYDIIVSSSSSSMTSVYWGRASVRREIVTGWVATVEARSRLDCVRQCQSEGWCGSAAFDAASRSCSLQPSRSTAGEEGEDFVDVMTAHRASILYPNSSLTPRECTTTHAPAPLHAYVSNWRVTSSWLEGDVSCDADYMFGEDNVTAVLRCDLESGSWNALNATCHQYTWRNYTAKGGERYPLPRLPAQQGWCMEARGTPTAETRFGISLRPSGSDILFRFVPRFNFHPDVNTTLLTQFYSDTWMDPQRLADPPTPFPFTVGVPFHLVIASVSEYDYHVYVDGEHYANFTAQLPVSDVMTVSFNFDVQMECLNLWC